MQVRGRFITGSFGFVLTLSLLLTACAGVQTGRIAPAMPLKSGEPVSACEREQWHELTPARVVATGTEAGLGYNTHYTQEVEGFGVFVHGEEDPEELEELWPAMREPNLQLAHEARIKPVDDAHATSTYWAVGGLIGMGAGIGVAAAIQEESGAGAAVVGITGLTIGLVAAVAALVTQPSGHDQLYADARRSLLIPREDDLDAAARGVDRMNWERRVKCGGPGSSEPGLVQEPTPELLPATEPDGSPPSTSDAVPALETAPSAETPPPSDGAPVTHHPIPAPAVPPGE